MDHPDVTEPTRDPRLFFYDSIADDFDRIANPYDLGRRLEVVFDELLPERLDGRRVLDVGAGTGWFSRRAVDRGARVVSLDIGARLLGRVREKCDSIPVVADACALPFPAAAFDTVISSECIEHTLDPLLALREMGRVLAPGGTLVVTTPNRAWRWSAWVAHVLKLRPYDGYEHWISRRQAREALVAEGVRLERMTGFHLVPPLFELTWPVLRQVDARGQVAAPLMLNFALRATKS